MKTNTTRAGAMMSTRAKTETIAKTSSRADALPSERVVELARQAAETRRMKAIASGKEQLRRVTMRSTKNGSAITASYPRFHRRGFDEVSFPSVERRIEKIDAAKKARTRVKLLEAAILLALAIPLAISMLFPPSVASAEVDDVMTTAISSSEAPAAFVSLELDLAQEQA